MEPISGEKLNTIKLCALGEAAAYVVARESGVGFYYPYINLYKNGEQWVVDGSTMAQFKDKLPPIIEWAMACAEGLSIANDEGYEEARPDDCEPGKKAAQIVLTKRTEIIDIARRLVDELFKKHGLVAHHRW